MNGVLVVDKPVGITSFDVVRRVRRAARVRRVGHGGTLDPLASGVLPICLGEATKLVQFLLDADKEYEVTVCLGVETDSYDATGAVTARRDASGVDEAAVRAALPAFTGRIRQVPPVYSALKHAGRPLYDYARAGEAVEAPPRFVTVYELELVRFDGPAAVALRVRCSKGTYVRSLAADLGRALGPGAHVVALRRTRSGPFAAAEARPLDELLAAGAGDKLPLVSPAAALGHLERVTADADLARALAAGQRVRWEALSPPPAAARVAVLRPDGALLTVAEPRADGTVRTLRVFTLH
jgi:tRNA pseudouridine55 synthase